MAKDLHLTAPRVHDIVRELRAITADTAVRLAKYFGMPAEFWLGLQADYDNRLAKGKLQNIKIKPHPRTAGVAGRFDRRSHRSSDRLLTR